MKTRLGTCLLALFVASAAFLRLDAAEPNPKPAAPSPPVSLELLRDPEVVELVRSIPVQDAGRVKPLDTVAYFRLLRFSGKTTIAMEVGGKETKLNYVEWFLVTLFRPDIAKDLRVFVVDNSETVSQLGVGQKEKRDRYSYNELLPGREALMNEGRRLRDVEPANRDAVQRGVAKLYSDFLDFEMMAGHLDFARNVFGDDIKAVPAEIVPANGPAPRIVPLLKNVSKYLAEHPDQNAPMMNPWLRDLYRALFGAKMSGNPEQVFRLFPSFDPAVENWQGPGTIMEEALLGRTSDPADENAFKDPKVKASFETWLSKYEDWVLSANNPAAFKEKLYALHDDIAAAATTREQFRQVPREVSFNKAEYFYHALLWFCGALLLLALSWAAPRGTWGRWCYRLSLLQVIVGAFYGVTGIVVRCLIMQRPPITTLYETIIFIATACVLFGLIAEFMTWKHLGLAVACVAGTVGMFISRRFMSMEGSDTLQQLQAVLITNFWLATHVPTINLGYAAGMVAAILSMVYFVMRLTHQLKPATPEARDLTRIAYGFVMAGLFLSLVGTILGGIWANYSWGRFWGWDPKENGALMIVLMNLVILHARLGGYVREVGFHCCNIVLGMIVAFSWFGVNQLGVGLHAYGFTEGIWKWLSIFWGIQLLFLMYGIILAFLDRSARPAPRPHAAPQGQPAAN